MEFKGFNKNYTDIHEIRANKTIQFLESVITKSENILDLGTPNLISAKLTEIGYNVENTEEGVDLDYNYEIVKSNKYDVITAFEILEHLVSPFPLLHNINAKKLVTSIPLKLWFANAYWNAENPFDRHYHEFEPRQFDMLLDKAGWKILKSEKWVSKAKGFGLRPFLRNFTPRYYIVYCERNI